MHKALIALFAFVTLSVSIMIPFKSASAMSPVLPADPIEWGDTIGALDLIELMDELGLLEYTSDSIIPSFFLQAISGHLRGSYPSDDYSLLDLLIGADNAVGVSTDGRYIQNHNGKYEVIEEPSDLWLCSDNMDNNTLIPFNYVAQDNGQIDLWNNGNSDVECTVIANHCKLVTNTGTLWVLPLCSYGDNVAFCTQLAEYSLLSTGALYYTSISTVNYKPVGSASHALTLKDSDMAYRYYSIGISPTTPTKLVDRASRYNSAINPSSGKTELASSGIVNQNLTWRDSYTGDSVSFTSGDISYLYYTSEPVCVPSDVPDGNYVYTTDPNNGGSAVVVSPSGDYGNLIDYLQNGFAFTGSISQDIDSSLSFNGSVNADVNLNHGGDITINFNDDLNIWADDCKSTDFGNGVSLDGNAFNDGFKWLLDGASAVPTALQSFSFIPTPVISIIASALVVMVFIGLWRTFKGG